LQELAKLNGTLREDLMPRFIYYKLLPYYYFSLMWGYGFIIF